MCSGGMAQSYPLRKITPYKASTALSIDLCPKFVRYGVGQPTFLFHISQQVLAISEGINVEKSI
mgnify:FL=1